MPDIPVSDSASLTVDLKLSDNSPFTKAKLSHLSFLSIPVIGDFEKPLDQISVKEVAFGASVQSPSALLEDGAKLSLKTGASGSIALVKNTNKDLFGNDPFSPRISLGSDDCWLKVELDTTIAGKVAGKAADGIGLSLDGISKTGFATYSLIQRSNGVFPTFKTALETAFANFSLTYSLQVIRSQKPGTVNVSESAGTLKFAASYSIPLSVSALASADLPFNYKLNVQPRNVVKIEGELALTGDFIVRCHKVSETQVELGVYKKRGISVQATFAAGAGLGLDIAKTDVLSPVLDALLPGVNLKSAGIDGPAGDDLRSVLKDSIDHHLALSVNAQFTDGLTDEAAVVYKLDLSSGDQAQTGSAISSALRGDWTALSTLTNAQRTRNVFEATRETRHKLHVNLLGILNAESLEAFTRSCTILHDDETGQVTITDKVKASQISVAARPLASDPKKLKSALAEAYLATATYVAAVTGDTFALTGSQTYLRFADVMSSAQMRRELLLGEALGQASQDVSENQFTHALIEASVHFDSAGAQRIFFADISKRTSRAANELEALGRGVLIRLLDSSDSIEAQRIAYLNNEVAWHAMNVNGDIAAFGELDELRGLSLPVLQAVAGDWLDITTWANAVTKVGPALRDVLNSGDANVAEPKRKALADMLAGVARHSRAAFAEGWGVAVTSTLLLPAGTRSFEMTWDGNSSVLGRNLPTSLTAVG